MQELGAALNTVANHFVAASKMPVPFSTLFCFAESHIRYSRATSSSVWLFCDYILSQLSYE